MTFYTPRNITPADQILFDSTGKAVGIQAASSSSPPVLGFDPTKHAAIDSLVSGDSFPLVTELRYATFGDSTANPGTIKATSATDQTVCDVALGTATTTLNRSSRDSLPLYYPAARYVALGGVSGESTTAMIAREAAAVSATRKSISDVVNLAPELVILRGGSINEMVGFTTATAQASIDGIFDRHMQIVDTLTSAGVRVLDEGIYGYDSNAGVVPAAADLAFIRAAIVQLNQRWAAAIAARSYAQVRFLDPSRLTHDGTGAFLAGMSDTSDGVHLTQYGLTVVAQAEAAVVRQWFGASAAKSYPGVNLLNTPAASLALYPAVTSGGSGDTPTGFALSNVNATQSALAVVQRDGRRWWQHVATPSGATPSSQVLLPFGVNTGATHAIPIVANGIYGAEFDWFVETLDGAPLPSGWWWATRVDLRNPSSGRLVLEYGASAATGSSPAGPARLQQHARFPPIQISDASAALTSSSLWRLNVNLVAGGPALRIGVSGANIVRIS
jgi:hypothetical protein